MTWHPVTPTSPRPEELPVTVVRSKERDRAYWTAYQTEEKVTDEMKQTVAQHFDQDELVCCEDWFPPLA